MSEQQVPGEPQNVADLPDWAQREIRDARKEAKSLRDRLAQSEADHESLKAEFEKQVEEAKATIALTDERAATAESTLQRNNLAYERGLPLNVAHLIAGQTQEEQIASADALAALRTPSNEPPARDPAQEAAPEVDPLQQAAEAFFNS